MRSQAGERGRRGVLLVALLMLELTVKLADGKAPSPVDDFKADLRAQTSAVAALDKAVRNPGAAQHYPWVTSSPAAPSSPKHVPAASRPTHKAATLAWVCVQDGTKKSGWSCSWAKPTQAPTTTAPSHALPNRSTSTPTDWQCTWQKNQNKWDCKFGAKPTAVPSRPPTNPPSSHAPTSLDDMIKQLDSIEANADKTLASITPKSAAPTSLAPTTLAPKSVTPTTPTFRPSARPTKVPVRHPDQHKIVDDWHRFITPTRLPTSELQGVKHTISQMEQDKQLVRAFNTLRESVKDSRNEAKDNAIAERKDDKRAGLHTLHYQSRRPHFKRQSIKQQIKNDYRRRQTSNTKPQMQRHAAKPHLLHRSVHGNRLQNYLRNHVLPSEHARKEVQRKVRHLQAVWKSAKDKLERALHHNTYHIYKYEQHDGGGPESFWRGRKTWGGDQARDRGGVASSLESDGATQRAARSARGLEERWTNLRNDVHGVRLRYAPLRSTLPDGT